MKFIFNLDRYLLYDLKVCLFVSMIGLSAYFVLFFLKKYQSNILHYLENIIKSRLFFWIISAGFIITSFILINLRAEAFQYTTDTAYVYQSIVNTANGDYFKFTIFGNEQKPDDYSGKTIFTRHQPILPLIVLSLLYKIFHFHFKFILFSKAVFIFFSIYLINNLILKKTGNYFLAHGISLIFYANFSLWYTAISEISYLTYGLPFIILVVHAILDTNKFKTLLYLILALLCSEIFISIIVLILFYFIFSKYKNKKILILPIVISLLYFIIMNFILVPVLGHENWKILDMYKKSTSSQIFNISQLFVFFIIISTTTGHILLKNIKAVIGIVVILVCYFLGGKLTWGFYFGNYHILNSIFVVLVLFEVFTENNISYKLLDKKILIYTIIIMNFFLIYFLGPLPFTNTFLHYKSKYNAACFLPSKHDEIKTKALKKLPENKSYFVTTFLLPYLANEQKLVVIQKYTLKYSPEYKFIDLVDNGMEAFSEEFLHEFFTQLRTQIENNIYIPIFYEDYILILKKRKKIDNDIKNIQKSEILKDLDFLINQDKSFFKRINRQPDYY